MLPVVMYVRKDFYLTAAINKQLQFLQAAGLIDYWHSSIIDERLLKVSESKEPKGIKIEYLSGCFYILTISCCLAIVIFLGELLNEKWGKSFKLKTKNIITDKKDCQTSRANLNVK